jgi:eukaryotic-like serine/threonine-protein kinase
MSRRESNDAIFQAALTPAAGYRVPAGLADEIHDALLATPQAKARPGWSIGGRRLAPVARTAWVLLVIAALLALVVAAVVLSSRPRPVPPGIPMYRGGPDRTGVMPGPGPAGAPVLLWQVTMKGTVAVMPVVSGGTVYVADTSGMVVAMDEASHANRWTRQLGSPVNASPALAGDLLILGTDDGHVTALHAATGDVAWSKQEGPSVRAAPAIVGDVVYVGSNDGNVYALDVATGDQRWATPLGGPVTRGVAVADGVVYAGATGGIFDALDAATGSMLWARTDLGPGEVATPMVADGLVFVASGLLQIGPSDQITALDVQHGRTRWAFPAPDQQPLYGGAVANGAVYVSSNDGDVYRLDEQTGKVAPGWPFHTGGGVGYLSGLVDGVLYIPSGDRSIYAVDVSAGKARWRFKVQGAPNVPAIIDGKLFVGTDLGKLVAIGGSVSASGSSP